jgi:hypothetical protein
MFLRSNGLSLKYVALQPRWQYGSEAFRKNILSPSSWSKIKPNKELAKFAARLLLVSCVTYTST